MFSFLMENMIEHAHACGHVIWQLLKTQRGPREAIDSQVGTYELLNIGDDQTYLSPRLEGSLTIPKKQRCVIIKIYMLKNMRCIN